MSVGHATNLTSRWNNLSNWTNASRWRIAVQTCIYHAAKTATDACAAMGHRGSTLRAPRAIRSTSPGIDARGRYRTESARVGSGYRQEHISESDVQSEPNANGVTPVHRNALSWRDKLCTERYKELLSLKEHHSNFMESLSEISLVQTTIKGIYYRRKSVGIEGYQELLPLTFSKGCWWCVCLMVL